MGFLFLLVVDVISVKGKNPIVPFLVEKKNIQIVYLIPWFTVAEADERIPLNTPYYS